MARKILLIVMGICLAWGVFKCQEARADEHECPGKKEATEASAKEEEKEEIQSICPKTFMADKCLYCHVAPTFKLKEADPNVVYDYPFVGATHKFHFQFDTQGNPNAGYFIITDVDALDLQKVMDYLDRHQINHLILELFTPGGSLIDAYKSVGLIRHWQSRGNIVETRCYGLAASAGFLIFASGTKGTRLIAPQAELMWHELQTLEIFNVTSPSDKEDEAKVLRHLQDTANSWLAEVSGKTKEEVDALVHKKEFWINGVEAVSYGFADGLLK